MSRPKTVSWVWRQAWWPQPLDPEVALQILERIATDHQLGEVVWEARARGGKVRYLVGVRPHHLRGLTLMLKALLPSVRLAKVVADARDQMEVAGRVIPSHPRLALSVDRVSAIARAVLAGLAVAGSKEELVLQVMLGGRYSPELVAAHPTDPKASWFDLLATGTSQASSEARASLKARVSHHGFKTVIRVGASGATPTVLSGLIGGVLSGLRVAEAVGVRLHFTREAATRLSQARRPWRWPLHLSTRELLPLMGWPLGEPGDMDLPGHPGAHPRLLAPPDNLKDAVRPFAISTAPGEEAKLGIAATDSLQHTLLLGPTASGKSTTMLALILDALRAGRSILVIDPKTDLINDVLARVPEARKGEVVVIDPTSPRPVGVNPMKGAGRSPELVADSILAVFKELFADSWGPRTQDVLTSALITLAHYPGATLTMLPSLLGDTRFRRKLTGGLTDQIGLGSFWSSYEAMSPAQRAQVIAPVMNKLRQFLLRPALRTMLGQADPVFDLADLFTKPRIVLVSLNKGLIGSESARLLGSLIVSQLWPLTLARAGMPPAKRQVVNVFIDEVQDYLALPTDLADALSQARGLGVGFTLAHQYRRQLPTDLRSGIDANVGNKIIFGLGAEDATDLAKQAPDLEAQDFMRLARFHIYTTLIRDGQATDWFSARTLPASSVTTDPVELRTRSATTYGRDAGEVEAEVLRVIGLEPTGHTVTDTDEPIGRRRTPKAGQS